MKLLAALTFAFMQLFIQTTAFAQVEANAVWGESIDVAYMGDIVFLLKTDASAPELKFKVEEYGSFECYVEIIQNDAESVLVVVDWSPGSDSSGCDIEIFHHEQYLGRSEVYMSY